MKPLMPGLLSMALGCALAAPREPYLWRDDAPASGVHRADVARAEARVVEYLVAAGTLKPEMENCGNSARAYQIVTVETPTAYQVRLVPRPGLCRQAPEETTLPPIPGIYDGPLEFAVSKRDLHLIRERLPGDASVPMFPEAPRTAPGDAPSLPQTSPSNAEVEKVPPAAASRAAGALAFTTPSLSVAAGICAGPVRVETRTSSGNPQPVAAPLTVNLAALPPTGAFFSDATCSAALTNTGVGAGTSSVEFYFRAVQAGPLQITASALGLSGDSQAHTVVPARAVAVAFTTPPRQVAAGTCSGALTVQSRDALDNPAAVPVGTPVQLVAPPAGGVKFYARPDCNGVTITRTTIPAGADSASFHFRARLPGMVRIAATLGTVTTSQDAVITPAPLRQPAR